MTFLEIMQGLVEAVPGSLAATIMGMDGLTIQQYCLSDYDVETVGVEYGKVIEEIKHASGVLNLGTVEEVCVATDEMTLVLKMVTQGYYIALVLSSGANTGKARFLLKGAALKAEKELFI